MDLPDKNNFVVILSHDLERKTVTLTVESDEIIEAKEYLECITEFIQECYDENPDQLFEELQMSVPFSNMQ